MRPIGPMLVGTVSSMGLGAPFVVAGSLKGVYDIVLWRWLSRIPLPDDQPVLAPTADHREDVR